MRPLLTLPAVLGLVLLLVAGALVPAAPARAATGGATTIRFHALTQDGVGTGGTAVVGEGARVALVPQLSWRWFGEQPSLPRLTLQRNTGSGWRTVRPASVSLPEALGDGPITVRTTPLRATGAKSVVRFRLVSRPYEDASGAVTNRSVSRVLRVVVEDRSRYTGVRRAAWRAVRRYCPHTAIRVVDLGGDRAGAYSTGGRLLQLDGSLRSADAPTVRSVALHECAHELQWLNYGGTVDGREAMEAAVARVYADDEPPAGATAPWYAGPSVQPFDPVEHAADCASVAIEPAGYLGYGGWCTAEELRQGRRLMRGAQY